MANYLLYGIIQKLGNATLLNINILEQFDTHTYVYESGGYSMFMFKSLTLPNF